MSFPVSVPLAGGDKAPPLFIIDHRCERESESASAYIDECRPGDIDHAETVVSLAVEDITGKLIAWSRPIGEALQVDVPLRIEWSLLTPVLSNEPFRLACGAAFPIFCRAEVGFSVFADEIGCSAGSEVFDEVLGSLDYLSAVVPPN